MMYMLKYLLIILILFSGCRSTKKITESSVNSSKSVDTTQAISEQIQTVINNDKTSDLVTTTVKTTYYPPEANKATTNEKTDTSKEIKGPVKSVEITTIKKGEVDKSKTEITQAKQEVNQVKSEDKAKIETSETVKITPKSAWWLWIVIGGGLAAALFFLSKTPVGIVVKTFFKKLFGKS